MNIITLLLGRFRSSAPFQYVFSIQVARLSLGVVLRSSNITPGGSEARLVGRNKMRKRDNKKYFKNHIISSIITSKDFLSLKMHKKLKKKPENYSSMDKQKCRWCKENWDSEQKFANKNNSFLLCPIRFYLSIESVDFKIYLFIYLFLKMKIERKNHLLRIQNQ